MPGQDFEAAVRLTFDQAFSGTEIELDMAVPEPDENGFLRRVPRKIKVRVPKGVTDGQKLRVPGKGGKGINGGRDGDLYLDIEVATHPLYRAEGLDLYMDLPLAPWEAVLGASVEVPTPSGRMSLKVPAGTRAGQKLRLAGRGCRGPTARPVTCTRWRRSSCRRSSMNASGTLFGQLKDASTFNPRAHMT